jgi:hypothetical protein
VHSKKTMRKTPQGQAAVEFGIVVTLVLFMIMGILQLSLIYQARALTQYAAFMAVRSGAVAFGDCSRMTHASIGVLLPAFESFSRGTAPVETELSAAFLARYTPPYTFKYDPARDDGNSEDIVWIRRQQPTVAAVAAITGPQNAEFDNPDLLEPQFRLEAELIFWYPMRIQFANWIIARIAMAHWGLIAFNQRNPIVNAGQSSDFGDSATAPPFDTDLTTELTTRVNAGHYVFPLRANYTMRMMTPVKKGFFLVQDCPPAP